MAPRQGDEQRDRLEAQLDLRMHRDRNGDVDVLRYDEGRRRLLLEQVRYLRADHHHTGNVEHGLDRTQGRPQTVPEAHGPSIHRFPRPRCSRRLALLV